MTSTSNSTTASPTHLLNNVDRYTSHETFSRHIWPWAHITLVAQGVAACIWQNHSCTCHHMFERLLFPYFAFFLSLSLALLLSLSLSTCSLSCSSTSLWSKPPRNKTTALTHNEECCPDTQPSHRTSHLPLTINLTHWCAPHAAEQWSIWGWGSLLSCLSCQKIDASAPGGPQRCRFGTVLPQQKCSGVMCNKPLDPKQHHCYGCRYGGGVDRRHAALARCFADIIQTHSRVKVFIEQEVPALTRVVNGQTEHARQPWCHMFERAFVVSSCLSLSCFSPSSTFSISQSTSSLSGTPSSMSSPPRVKTTALTHNEEYCPMAMYNPLTGYEPNLLDNVDYSETSAMLFQDESGDIDSEPYYSCDAELDDKIIGKALFSPTHLGARRTSEQSLLPAQSSFAHTFTERPVHELSSCKQKSSRDMENERIRILFERHKEQILAEVRTEIQKHEFQAESDRRKYPGITWNYFLILSEGKVIILLQLVNNSDEIN